jgi:hypothetical protein
MAPPTGVLDGNENWFYRGQSVMDPGLTRTAFGIPADCVNPFVGCDGGGCLTHFSWDVYNSTHVHIGYFSQRPDFCTSILTTFSVPYSVFLLCGTIDVPGFHYEGIQMNGEAGSTVIWYYLFDQVGPEPSLLFRVVPGQVDFGDFTLVYKAGP